MTLSDKWIEDNLRSLALTAWGPRPDVRSSDFFLNPRSLPAPVTPLGMEEVVQGFYRHARKWAPGFEIPFSIPTLTIAPFLESAGQYRADTDGYLFIDVSPEFVGHYEAILSILAHEACHHILDISSIRANQRDATERLTDLAMFICGFGDVFLQGHSGARAIPSGWVNVHLGYFTPAQYRTAQDWVLRQRAPGPAAHLAASSGSTDSSTSGPGLWHRLMRLLRKGPASDARATSVPTSSGPETRTSEPLLIDVCAGKRRIVLNRLGGDEKVLNRLIELERRRQPAADELTLLDAVLERYERDRR